MFLHAVLLLAFVSARSVAAGSTPLEAVVQQQAALIHSLQATVTSLLGKEAPAREAVQEDLAKLIQSVRADVVSHSLTINKLENQHGNTVGHSPQAPVSRAVAFSVRFKADSASGLPLATHSTLKFDNVITNIGNGYDHVTGIFTAPVTGVYAFFLSAMSANQQASIRLSIDKHGVILGEVFVGANGTNTDHGSTQTVENMSAGEQVWVRQKGGTVVRGGYCTGPSSMATFCRRSEITVLSDSLRNAQNTMTLADAWRTSTD